jgi:aconitate hydratase
LTKANYLCSPPLVVAFALAGTCDFDMDTQSLGNDKEGKPVFLKDIWPSREEVEELEKKYVRPDMYKEIYKNITQGNQNWEQL